MYIQNAELQVCLAKAADIADIYKLHYLNSNATIRSVDSLVDLIGKHQQKNVLVKETNLPAEGEPIKGFYVAFDDRYEVVVLAGQNYCWKRFVLCKELFHVILDDDEYRSMELGNLVDEYINALPQPIAANPPVAHELVAEICAMEFLFPYAERLALSQAQTDAADIAERYKVPRVYVERYLSQRYMDNLAQFYEIKDKAA
ncbi:ImmA/IrrE family metallo-endopeptidase [Burkholderia gladioli]|uniref:ImmA/IrrE family metallo-endopeptidase n=1 Tax=Burkholderia gladioli TaxID=28095 RepID=UPI000CFEE84A|nr:ImmA/IrrE family metallo-endopeptidase [Burkholderia gladioli]MDN7805428.1 ImmA/IrrE family metallo-endopeptidase [Burkholderia gladioli]PRH01608.1 hypothetical protein C6V08_14340 [Burkholderia gladioli]PRH32969.1 hypothetical protein C6V07_24365 [Burkholderia gladioli]